MSVYLTADGQPITLMQELGKGGEGVVYGVRECADQVAKVYHPSHRSRDREDKLQIMVASPPGGAPAPIPAGGGAVAVAWPTGLLYERGRFAGYLMPKVSQSPDIFKLFNPQLRLKHYPWLDWRHLFAIARSLAQAVDHLHSHGVVVGDINQKNVLVSRNVQVMLVDTDSFQVRDPRGKVFHCPVGVPDYTPPELQGVHLGSVERSEFHDRFGLAVVLFQLLMEGFHPFTGVPLDPKFSATGEFYLYAIRHGIFPYQPGSRFSPPPGAPPFDALPPDLQNMFLRCFVIGHQLPAQRPSAEEWVGALGMAEKRLVQCKSNPTHWISAHAGMCHWCRAGQPSPTPGAKPRPRPAAPASPSGASGSVAPASAGHAIPTLNRGDLGYMCLGAIAGSFLPGIPYFLFGQWPKFLVVVIMGGIVLKGNPGGGELVWPVQLFWAVDVAGLMWKYRRNVPIGPLTLGVGPQEILALLGRVRLLWGAIGAGFKRRVTGMWLPVRAVVTSGYLIGVCLVLMLPLLALVPVPQASFQPSHGAGSSPAGQVKGSASLAHAAPSGDAPARKAQGDVPAHPLPAFVPETVPIQGGSFQMGASPLEREKDVLEKYRGNLRAGKVRQVEVAGFRLGKHEVTVGQFRMFVTKTGYRTDAEKGHDCAIWKDGQAGAWTKDSGVNWRTPGFAQTDDDPVVCVSWRDATQYTRWLAQETGEPYRLPSEEEWEFAARAGTVTVRYWGDDVGYRDACQYANVRDESHKAAFHGSEHFNCRDGHAFTSPAGRFRPNALGLFDMLGNVAEWTASPHEDSGNYVFRGGSWGHVPASISGAYQRNFRPAQSGYAIGFRVAR
ncbi:MAG: SUMF1/EgtB/PvdO family nonheme iron enzyme [Betaproteobacteria bacterium]|nr:SUMF1/EgtB/PvdO family nonheme iron enzyme [Betaproteobacteria bacterium]